MKKQRWEGMKRIAVTEVGEFEIGHAQDEKNGTGCTVILCRKGAPAGVDVRGGGPASRETQLLNPQMACEEIHAVLLSGGSAFGLDAAGGVMEYLEEKGIGVKVGPACVPLVCTSCIFDLNFGSGSVRPGKKMGREACENASSRENREGNAGAGCGATVGKLKGSEFMMKSGLGMYALQAGELKVGAVVVVNALGDVLDDETGEILAGMRKEDGSGFADSEQLLYQLQSGNTKPQEHANTTIGVIVTNARFSKSMLNKIAAMAQNGYARTICPVHTMADGDSIYALSLGDCEADVNVVGTLAARVMGEAVKRAVLHTESLLGVPSAKEFNSGIRRMDRQK